MLIDFANKPLSEMVFTSLDLETTGLEPGKAEIIEFAAVKFNKLGEISRFNKLCKPTKGLNYMAMKVNGITETDLENANEFEEEFKNFIQFIDQTILVIQNAEFDLGFLLHEAWLRNISFPTLPVFCTVQLTRKVYPGIKHNLENLRKVMGIGHIKSRSENSGSIHEALDDSYAAMEVLKTTFSKLNGWEKKFTEVVFHEKKFTLTDHFKVAKLFD